MWSAQARHPEEQEEEAPTRADLFRVTSEVCESL